MFFADKERFIDSIEKDRLLTIARSAFNIVTVFLASPALVTPNLPIFIYTTIWYGLLVLSKLNLLSDTATESKVVYNKDVSNLGLAAMQKMETNVTWRQRLGQLPCSDWIYDLMVREQSGATSINASSRKH